MPPMRKPESTKKRSTPLQVSWPIARNKKVGRECVSIPCTELTPKTACRSRTSKIATPRRLSSAGMRADQLGIEVGGGEGESAAIGSRKDIVRLGGRVD